jgi:hypothetical protein
VEGGAALAPRLAPSTWGVHSRESLAGSPMLVGAELDAPVAPLAWTLRWAFGTNVQLVSGTEPLTVPVAAEFASATVVPLDTDHWRLVLELDWMTNDVVRASLLGMVRWEGGGWAADVGAQVPWASLHGWAPASPAVIGQVRRRL